MPSKKSITVRGVQIGGGAPVVIQSMTNTDTRDVAATVDQIRSLVSTGCQVVRLTVQDQAAADAFKKIRKECPDVPLVADIHFDYNMALEAITAGADKIRINPGNLGGPEKLKEVVAACKAAGIPIRVGVNAGSFEKDLSSEDAAAKLVESALKNVKLVEEAGYDQICVSAKSSTIAVAVTAYRELAKQLDYPLHIGITEAGGRETGSLKSAAGLGALLLDGIGDTVRMSLSDDPAVEVVTLKKLLRLLGLRNEGVEVIACPTCGRTEVEMIPLVKKVEDAVAHITQPLTVAVMGCVVNGPGEAAHADYAIIGGRGQYALMAAGKHVKSISEEEALPALLKLIESEK